MVWKKEGEGGKGLRLWRNKPMPSCSQNGRKALDNAFDFTRKFFAGVLRSRTGSLTVIATLLRFRPGTRGFHRRYEKLVPLLSWIDEAYKEALREAFPEAGLRLGIIDDSLVKKTGVKFPKEKVEHDHLSGQYCTGFRVLSSALYQCGKLAAVSSRIVGKGDNKLEVAREDIDTLVNEFGVDVLLFDSWYCKNPLLGHVAKHGKTWISRVRADSAVMVGEKETVPLNVLARELPHKDFDRIRIKGKSYWICEAELDFKAYGTLRVIISKEEVHDKSVFLTTNSQNFIAKFVVKLYLRRFQIEIFFKDAKQFLNFETFLCRGEDKWKLHLTLIHVLHWAAQSANSISKTIRSVRENLEKCLLYINENPLLNTFFEKWREKCQT